MKFEKNGYEVATAASSDDALTKLTEGLAPDVIILDVIMPGMDGIELLQEIKNKNLASQAKILIAEKYLALVVVSVLSIV